MTLSFPNACARVAASSTLFLGAVLALSVGEAAAQGQPDWLRARVLERRSGHATAYDAVRQKVVLFGGATGSILKPIPNSDTWEWDGTNWVFRDTTTGPSPRRDHAMAFDLDQQRVVSFGGFDGTRHLAETWVWDGSIWTHRTPAISPSARSKSAMAYDVVRQRVVLFGGMDGNTRFTDTWEWDGSNWVLRTPANSPSPRDGHAMVYDLARQRVLLFGGYSLSNDSFWEWDGNDWTQRSSANGPATRYDHAMVYDSARQRVVLFGGSNGFYFDTWEWDGMAWTQRVPANRPPARAGHAMAYDVARQRVVLIGGWESNGPARFADTWEWDGRDWQQRSPTASPSARWRHAMAYDLARRRVVMFGGSDGNLRIGDTWEWDGRDWILRTPSQSPTARYEHAMAYDIVRQRVVLFGGSSDRGAQSDTWEWDGSNWNQRSPASSPSGRHLHAMAYDLARQRVVLFGGWDGSSMGAFGDTWEWDGSNWSLRTPANSPDGRVQSAMAYDFARQGVVLFGGANATLLSDTWVWNGSDWSQHVPSTSPSARTTHAMTYDVTRQRVVLFGGGGASGRLSDTWEWDGRTWTAALPSRKPTTRAYLALAYDIARQHVVLFGGESIATGPTSDTWLYSTTAASALPLGIACSSSNARTILTSTAPYLGNPVFALQLLSARPHAACVIGLAAATQTLPVGPCTLYLQDPIVAQFAVTNWAGFAESTGITLPLDHQLRGLTVFAQAFVADPQGPAFGLAFSAGRRLVIGD